MSEYANTVTHFLFEDLDIRGALVQLSGSWVAMQQDRDYPPQLAALLGEMTAITALICSNLKTPGRLTFQAQAHDNASLLVVDCEDQADQLHIRGLARCKNLSGQAPVRELFGDGKLMLNLQYASAEQPYQSFVPLVGETVAEIFEHYLLQSEQQPTRLWLSANGEDAVGLFLQTLPASGRQVEEDQDAWNRIQQLAATVKPNELLLPVETLLGRLFAEDTIRVFEPQPVIYYCPRDEDKVRGMLAALGRSEVENLIAEHGEIVVRDDICNQEYRFGPGVIEELFPSVGQTLH